jgi:ASC-1-like (ASCH) protein
MPQTDLKGKQQWEIGKVIREVRRERPSFEKKIEDYEDFYQRAFTETDVEEIYQEGGSADLDTFKDVSRVRCKNQDYWKAMFEREGVSKPTKLGTKMFEIFFADERLRKIKTGRIQFVKGMTPFVFEGKLRRPGQFPPKSYYGRGTKR